MAEPSKTTEFNMSLATLERLNDLIIQAHLASQGLFSKKLNMPLNDNQFYLNALDRIYIEAQTKMSFEERQRCMNFRTLISNTMRKWQKDIFIPTKNDQVNKEHFRAWAEVKSIAREYEVYLMQVMDSHKMLLKDSARVDKGLIDDDE